MAKQEKLVSFTFENPNGNDVFEQVLRKILIDKLAAQLREESAAA